MKLYVNLFILSVKDAKDFFLLENPKDMDLLLCRTFIHFISKLKILFKPYYFYFLNTLFWAVLALQKELVENIESFPIPSHPLLLYTASPPVSLITNTLH